MIDKFQVVGRTELMRRLGKRAHPGNRGSTKWYVIGPDMEGKLTHLSTHFIREEAVKRATHLNNYDL